MDGSAVLQATVDCSDTSQTLCMMHRRHSAQTARAHLLLKPQGTKCCCARTASTVIVPYTTIDGCPQISAAHRTHLFGADTTTTSTSGSHNPTARHHHPTYVDPCRKPLLPAHVMYTNSSLATQNTTTRRRITTHRCARKHMCSMHSQGL